MESKSLKVNFMWNTFGSFTYLFCQWLLTFFVVRLSSDIGDAGNLSLAISITNIFYNLACFELRPYLVSDNTNEYNTLDYISFRIVTIIFSLIACIIYVFIFRYNITQVTCILLYMIYKIGEAIVDLLHAFEQRKERMDIGGISLFIRGILSIVFFILGMKLFNSLNIAILLMIVMTYLFILCFDFNKVKKFEEIKVNFNINSIKKLFIKLLPLAMGIVLFTSSATLPRQILEKLYGNDILGIYATIATPAVFVQVAATYIYSPLLVTFSNYRKSNDYKKFRGLIIKSILILLGISICSYFGSIILAKPVLKLLYGIKIAKYYKLFNLIIVYTSLVGFLLFGHNILIILRKIKTLLFVYFSGFLVCIISSYMIINKYVMDGVTYSLLLSTGIMIIEIFIIIYKSMLDMKNKAYYGSKIIHTFVILAYKESKYLEDCIKSVINQEYKSNVIIATTTDNKYIRDLAKKYKIKVIVGKHTSIGGDFNFAISSSNTELVTIAHQDDIYDYEYSKYIVDNYYRYKRSIIIFTDYYEIRREKKVKRNINLVIKRILLSSLWDKRLSNIRFLKRNVLRYGNAISCPAVTFVRDNISSEVFSKEFQCNVDWDAWERLSRLKGHFIFVNRKLMGHRIDESTTTSNIIKKGIRTKEDYLIYLKFWPKFIAKLLNKAYSNSEKSNKLR